MKRVFAFVFALALCTVYAVSPANASYTIPDLSEECSLTIEMKRGNKALSDALVTIYKVADTEYSNALLWYTLTADFASTDIDFKEMNSASENLKFAKTLKSFVRSNDISGTSASTDYKGVVTFSNLDAGIYLVVPAAYTGYNTMDPYMLMLPQANADGTNWTYNVQATPKTEITPSEEPTETPTTSTTPPSSSNPPSSSRPPSSSEPPSRTSPPSSQPPSSSAPPIDGSYEVLDPDEIPLGTEDIWSIPPEGIPLGDLPQTGVLRWPIPVLSIGGMILFSFGWILTSREKKSDEI